MPRPGHEDVLREILRTADASGGRLAYRVRMQSLRRPQADTQTVALGLDERWQWTALVPLVLGLLIALVVPPPEQVAAMGLGALFALMLLYGLRMRVIVEGPRMRMRNSVRWHQVRLDQLATVRAVPASRSGPLLHLQDRGGNRCWIRLHGLPEADRQHLLAILQPYVCAEDVERVGPVQKILTTKA